MGELDICIILKVYVFVKIVNINKVIKCDIYY